MMRRVQASIDQARLTYRARNVITFSVLLLPASYLAADVLQLFPFLILKILFAIGSSVVPFLYIRITRRRRMWQLDGMLPDAIDLLQRVIRARQKIHSVLRLRA